MYVKKFQNIMSTFTGLGFSKKNKNLSKILDLSKNKKNLNLVHFYSLSISSQSNKQDHDKHSVAVLETQPTQSTWYCPVFKISPKMKKMRKDPKVASSST